MPVTRSEKTIHRSTSAPYPVALPPSHPPAFDVDELYNWSSNSSTSIELTSQRSLPPRYSWIASPSPASPNKIERFFTPVYSCSPVTPGSSTVKLPLRASSLAISVQPDIGRNRAAVSSDAPATSPKRIRPVDHYHSLPGPSPRPSRTVPRGSNSPAKPYQSRHEVYISETESEESGSEYEEDEQPENGNYAGHEGALDHGSGGESEDQEEDEGSNKGGRSRGQKDKKRYETPWTEEVMNVGNPAKVTRPTSERANRSMKFHQVRSRDRTPTKQSSNGSIQAQRESHEGDCGSIAGKDGTPEQPWE
ncbi:hypothetical protein RSOL_391370, partial [Rhizoctonia solani AG-3 Rhs1AP]